MIESSDLWPAICDFTNPTRQAIAREPINSAPFVEWATVPSLWDQLLKGDARSGGDGTSVPGSRIPLSVNVVMLIQDVQFTTARQLRAYARQYWRQRWTVEPRDSCPVPLPDPTGDVPTDLRTLRKAYRADPDRAQALATVVRQWITTAGSVLGLERLRSAYIRVPCMSCGARMIAEHVDGEAIRRPVIRIIWTEDKVTATECQACGDTRWPADFHLLAEAAVLNSNVRETMVGGVVDRGGCRP